MTTKLALVANSARQCPECGVQQGTMPLPWHGGLRYLWRPCACRDTDLAERAARDAARQAAHVNASAQQDTLGDLTALADQALTIDTFQPDWLAIGADGDHPYDIATVWLDQALATGARAVHRDPANMGSLLFFTSPTRGCGKTHLAAALALKARTAGRSATFVEEKQLLAAYWGGSLAQQEHLLTRCAERPWLLVIDDLGRRPVRRQGDEETTGVADVWDAMLNRRYVLGGWTIITSNRSPTELLDAGTINLSTFSRIAQMSARRVVRFCGVDRRLAGLQNL